MSHKLAQLPVTIILICTLTTACSSYRWGQRTLYRPDVRTVHVPIFESESFRRNMGERLTEAVAKQINLTTPYQVVGPDEADSVLRGRIVAESKKTIAEDEFDVPRVIEVDLVVDVRWIGPQGDLLANSITLPVDDYFMRVGQADTLIPEAGQSVATAHQDAIDRLARQIVAQMEMPPW